MQFTGLPFEQIAQIGGAAAAIITVLYLLKLRKRRVQVPFSPLWGQVLAEYRQQSDWWRRLRRLLSWLLQLLLVALIAFALADPHPEGEITEGRHIVLLLDSSASMASTDVQGGVNRLHVAKQKARQILETVGAEDRVMLVNFNDQLQPLSPFVAEVSLIEQPLRDIKVVATGTRFDQALRFGADSLKDKKRGELILLSDGAGFNNEELEAVDFAENTTVRHIKLGESAGNIAVTAFSVRRYLANKLDYELFVRVDNLFDRQIDAELQILADGKLVDTKPIKLEPKGSLQQFYPSQAVSGEKLEARVKILTADARDVFPLDDKAFALLPPTRPVKVLLVTSGNLYLEGTLLLNANIDLDRITPGEYNPGTHGEGNYDVVFIDREIPSNLAASGNYVFVSPGGENSPWEVSGQVADPIITSYKKSHPLMRWIGMRDVNIGLASKLKLGKGDTVVASAFGTPMIVTRDEGTRRMIAIAFDIRNSDLPLRVAFPVLMINLVDYFQLDDSSLIQDFATGETWSVRVSQEEGKAMVTSPSGGTREVPIYGGQALVYGEEVGFYEVQAGSEMQRVAANLSDPNESQIAPKELELPGQEVASDTNELFFNREELWIWAILILLALLVLEWWTYNRRITV
jgi:hypothetical protein